MINPHKIMEKTQGSTARMIDKAPKFVQNSIARTLGYHHDFDGLNPFLKCMLATQKLLKRTDFIEAYYPQSRILFEQQMQSICNRPTALKKVEDIQIPLKRQILNARLYHPQPNTELPLIVFFHGGGFVVGSIETHDEACRLLAKHAHVQVLSVDYPLAPEHSPQHIVACCIEALKWVHSNRKLLGIENNRIAVAGDSAGGNLSTVIAQKTRNTAHAPTAQLLVYPMVDFKNRHASHAKFSKGLILTDSDIYHVTNMYALQHQIELDDPLISPTFGKLDKKIAPTFILTSSFDILHDEGQLYAEKLKNAGVKVEYHEIADQTHGFINFTPIHEAAKLHWINIAKKFRIFWDNTHWANAIRPNSTK